MADPKSLQEEKAALRRQALAQRATLTDEFRQAVAQKLVCFADELAVEQGTIISGFLPIRDEIDLRPLLFELGRRGAIIGLPAVISSTEIVFRKWSPSSGEDLVEAGFGTLAPSPSSQIINPKILLVPLSAYDEFGGRMGYGAGYYDRAIAKLMSTTSPRRIGVAFSLQRVDKVPMGTYDMALDGILTENGYQPHRSGC